MSVPPVPPVLPVLPDVPPLRFPTVGPPPPRLDWRKRS